MANIITNSNEHDRLGKTRSEQEENLREEWDTHSMTDEQLDKCKYLERCQNDECGSKKNFNTGIDIDEVGKNNKPVDPHFGHKIRVCGYSRQGQENFDKIKWEGYAKKKVQTGE